MRRSRVERDPNPLERFRLDLIADKLHGQCIITKKNSKNDLKNKPASAAAVTVANPAGRDWFSGVIRRFFEKKTWNTFQSDDGPF